MLKYKIVVNFITLKVNLDELHMWYVYIDLSWYMKPSVC